MRLVMPVLMTLIGCSSGDGHRRDERTVLRLSTSFGVAPVTPATTGTFAKNLMELVFDPAERHFVSAVTADDHVRLQRRSSSPFDAAQLAAKLRHARLRAATADGDAVNAWLDRGDGDSALEFFWVDSGPYEQAAVSSDRLRLRRRGSRGMATIDVIAMPTQEEEWRRFLAREVDLVPFTAPSHLRYLRDVPTVKIVRVARPLQVALYFNTRRVAPAVRRGVSLSLRRRAIAQVVTENPAQAIDVAEDAEAGAALLGEKCELAIVTDAASSDFQRAALIVQSQLAERNITTHIQLLPVLELQSAIQAGRFETLLFFGGWDLRWSHLLLSESSANVTGYASREYDAAVAAKDAEKIRLILEREVPITPLYRVNEGVALDAHLCGAHPDTFSDLTWLTDVHPCAPGEQ